MKHVALAVDGSDPPGTQPVEVDARPDGTFLILHSPGFVEGIAAGDVVRITDRELGLFEVVERGGNVSLKWSTPDSIAGVLDQANAILSELSASFDGAIEHAAVWTVPVAAGFSAIEERMERVVALRDGSSWWYGNVYDDKGAPLNWWE